MPTTPAAKKLYPNVDATASGRAISGWSAESTGHAARVHARAGVFLLAPTVLAVASASPIEAAKTWFNAAAAARGAATSTSSHDG